MKKFKFRLLAGCHMDTGPSGPNHIYSPGEVIETDKDLAGLFNRRDSHKFERVNHDQEVLPTDGVRSHLARLDSLSEPELRAMAEAEDIDLKGCKGREEALAKIKRSLLQPA